MEVISADYDPRACPVTVSVAIIHYQPDPNDCSIIKKDQVNNLMRFPFSTTDLPYIDLPL